MRQRGSHKRFWVVAAIVALLAVVPARHAGAVVGGQFDGEAHPNVGLVVGLDADGFGLFSCTGTLVASATVLTAAHCLTGSITEGVVEFVVDFDAQLPLTSGGYYQLTRYVVGTPDPHPAYRDRPTTQGAGGAADFFANSANDIGLLHLSRPAAEVFPGISPAPLAPAGSNDQYRTGQGKKGSLLQVGYGVQRLGPPGQSSSFFIDYTRNRSSVEPAKLTDALLYIGANSNDSHGFGSPCSGDSGSPVFRGASIVSLFVFAGDNCMNRGGGPRVDAGPGRAFLVSRGLVN